MHKRVTSNGHRESRPFFDTKMNIRAIIEGRLFLPAAKKRQIRISNPSTLLRTGLEIRNKFEVSKYKCPKINFREFDSRFWWGFASGSR